MVEIFKYDPVEDVLVTLISSVSVFARRCCSFPEAKLLQMNGEIKQKMQGKTHGLSSEKGKKLSCV